LGVGGVPNPDCPVCRCGDEGGWMVVVPSNFVDC
jgi:hypothetical protein